MSKYLIKDEILISRPLVFLCGSYFNPESKEDKRYLTLKYLESISNGRVYPLIIDTFLDYDALEDNLFSIEKYEELIANISVLNLIYLESFSSASELGLFTSNTSTTKNIVFYPDSSNLILNKVGYFIQYGVFEGKKEVIESKKYLAYVERYAHGTDYVDEHYYFLKNELPENIKESISREIENIINTRIFPKYEESNEIPKSLELFSFVINNSLNKIFLSAQTAFYMLYAFVSKDNTLFDITTMNPDECSQDYLDLIVESITNTLLNKNRIVDVNAKYEIEILTFKNPKEFIKYALFFIKYLTREMFDKKMVKKAMLAKSEDIYERFDDYPLLESKLISIPQNLSNIIKTKGIRRFTLFKNNKTRHIIAYSENSEGEDLRNVHEFIKNSLETFGIENGCFSDDSFAYKKGLNSLKCVQKHLNSKYFLKLDIHKFFETMDPLIFENKLIANFRNASEYIRMDTKQKNQLASRIHSLVNVLVIFGSFPIGFVTSPIVSEIYLNEFDKEMVSLLKTMNIEYTRYADDMLFSSTIPFDCSGIEMLAEDLLKKEKLTINNEKTMYKSLLKEGDYIRFIGLNIVKCKEGNRITIGNTYIKRLARLAVYECDGLYNKKRIQGLEEYLKYNDSLGYKKYQKIKELYKTKK